MTPKDAGFLSEPEKSWLSAEVQRGQSAPRGHGIFWSVIRDIRVLFFSLIYALILCALYGVIYWIPTVVKGFGVTGTQNGLLSSVPWAIAAVALMIIPRRLKQEPETLIAMALLGLVGLLAFLASTLVSENWMRFVGMAIGTPCVSLLLPCFWSLPSRRFSGAQAATAIGAISTLGNLGGFIAQNVMPYVAQATGSAVGAMLVPAACITVVGLAAVAMRYSRTGVSALVAEYSPSRTRATLVSIMYAAFPLGGVLGGLRISRNVRCWHCVTSNAGPHGGA
jgi:nitrate/nitrite transporter NarK